MWECEREDDGDDDIAWGVLMGAKKESEIQSKIIWGKFCNIVLNFASLFSTHNPLPSSLLFFPFVIFPPHNQTRTRPRTRPYTRVLGGHPGERKDLVGWLGGREGGKGFLLELDLMDCGWRPGGGKRKRATKNDFLSFFWTRAPR